MLERITKLDKRIANDIEKIHNKVLNKFMVTFTYLGVGGLVWFCTLGIPMLFFEKFRIKGLCVIVTIIVNWLLSEILTKKLVGRKRPSNFISEEELLVSKPDDASFPSGHASSSFASFAVAALVFPWYFAVGALVVALLIGFSRVYLRVHYLSDVVCGAVFGFMVGCTVTALFNKFGAF